MISWFSVILRRDLVRAIREKSQWMLPLFFFVLCIALFPIAIDPSPKFLQQIAGGVIWVSVLLSVMINLQQVFAGDHAEGTLDALVLAPKPLTVTVLAKSASHWIASCLPIVLLSPALASALHLPTHIILPLTLSLLLGTPALSMIGGMAAALTVTIKNGTVLITLLVLPLCIPVLIVGTGAVVAATNGLPYVGHIGLLSAYSLLCLSLMPLAIAAALKISVSTG